MPKKVDITEQQLSDLISRGLSIRQLADELGCSTSTVRSRMKKWGLTASSSTKDNGSSIMSTDKENVELVPPSDSPSEKPAFKLGVGLDIGTMNIVSARRSSEGVQTRRIRDAFLDVDLEHKKMLSLGDTTYVEYEDKLLIIGDDALSMATMLKRDARRPLSQGLISSQEVDALSVLSIMIGETLGEPNLDEDGDGEVCYFSIPAAPVDLAGRDVVYHESVFEQIIEELGYTAYSGNEALAIIFSECAEENFSGIGISFGSGMVNIALAFKTFPAMQFSLARGGDWIDAQSAAAIGTTATRMCTIKERGLDLMNPETREQEALVIYYKNLINYALKNIAREFKKSQSDTELDTAIPIVVSGGTSLPEGFVELFQSVFDKKYKKKFPLDISEIRRAKDPMTAVSAGLLVQAMQEHD